MNIFSTSHSLFCYQAFFSTNSLLLVQVLQFEGNEIVNNNFYVVYDASASLVIEVGDSLVNSYSVRRSQQSSKCCSTSLLPLATVSPGAIVGDYQSSMSQG